MIVLLRGINLGSHNRIAMPELRDALTDSGLQDARTYVQSGNIVLETELSVDALVAEVERVIAERFSLQIPVVVRTRDELAAVVEHDPLGAEAVEPKRYQVSFLSQALDPAVATKLHARVAPSERLVIDERELYAWHPEGVARSKLWSALAGRGIGVTATARNWTTVTTLPEMADAS